MEDRKQSIKPPNCSRHGMQFSGDRLFVLWDGCIVRNAYQTTLDNPRLWVLAPLCPELRELCLIAMVSVAAAGPLDVPFSPEHKACSHKFVSV